MTVKDGAERENEQQRLWALGTPYDGHEDDARLSDSVFNSNHVELQDVSGVASE